MFFNVIVFEWLRKKNLLYLIGYKLKIYRSDNYKYNQIIKDEDFEFNLGLFKVNENLMI